MTASYGREGVRLKLWVAGLVVALIAGAALRPIWPDDMEIKRDEIRMFTRAQNVGVSEPSLAGS